MILRPYQQEACNAFFSDFRSAGTSGVIQAATGAGKSLIIANICHELKDARILVICHSADILQQNMRAFGKECSVYCAGLGSKDMKLRVTFASRDSFVRYNGQGRFDLIIVDECHLVPEHEESGYQKIFARESADYILGLTATPYRMDNGVIYGANKTFKKLLYKIGVEFLTNEGFLAPYTWPENIGLIDTSKLKKVAGDFDVNQQELILNEPVVASAISVWERMTTDRKLSMFFCCSISHAQMVHQMIPQSLLITGETKPEERDFIFSQAKSGKYKALINVAVCTTGVDIPTIDCIVFLRATQSASLAIQMLGRGLRVAKDKHNCLVLDFAGNYERFGHPDNPFIIKSKKRSEDQDMVEEMLDGMLGAFPVTKDSPTKTCEKCDAVWHVAKKRCDNCGKLFINHSTEAYNAGAMLWYDVVNIQTQMNVISQSGNRMHVITVYLKGNKQVKQFYRVDLQWAQTNFIKMKTAIQKGIEAVTIETNSKGFQTIKSMRLKASSSPQSLNSSQVTASLQNESTQPASSTLEPTRFGATPQKAFPTYSRGCQEGDRWP